jgi:NAD(P)H-dependent FMN reductase
MADTYLSSSYDESHKETLMAKPKVGIVLGSVREGRFAEKALDWFKPIAEARSDLDFEVIDLKDYPLPFFDEAVPPGYGQPAENETANKWRARIAEFDGYVFVTAEYAHGPTAVLKNALDWAFFEWQHKAVAFLAYGSVGGARAVEQLRTYVAELQMASVRQAVHIGGSDFMSLFSGKSIADFPYYADNANTMLDQLSWWATTLKQGRDKQAG